MIINKTTTEVMMMTYIGVAEEMFETGDVRDQASQALLEVFVKESVHDRIRAD